MDQRSLALVGGDARVLEHLGRAQEGAPLARGALEVEARALDGLGTEHALERRDVRVLVARDDGGEAPDRTGVAADAQRLVVERGLEVLERERVVEDLDVVLLGAAVAGARDTWEQERGRATGAGQHRDALEQSAARVALLFHPGDRLGD